MTTPPDATSKATTSKANGPRASRRGLLAAVGGLATAVGSGFSAHSAVPEAGTQRQKLTEEFWGLHQGGIVTLRRRTATSPRSI
jgi:hypothetical protein